VTCNQCDGRDWSKGSSQIHILDELSRIGNISSLIQICMPVKDIKCVTELLWNCTYQTTMSISFMECK